MRFRISEIMIKKTLICIIFTFIISCQKEFNKKEWLINVGGEYSHRDKMLKSLIKNTELKGKTFEEIMNLLGNPNDYCNYDKYELGYRIKKIDDLNSSKIKSLVLTLEKPKEEVDLSTKVIEVKIIYW